MPADNTAHLAAATRRRVTGTRQRARAALNQLDRDGATINYVTVARAASVSRTLLYRCLASAFVSHLAVLVRPRL